MQTNFTLAQLADPKIAEAERILRACVHCGFCTATCPTFVLTGDELDSPRGRIYQIKDLLESGRPADPETTLHVDRCLSCLSCMTTCPSGVDYMHLVDIAREKVEVTARRPWLDRLLRQVLVQLLPNPRLFRLAIVLGRLAKPLAPVIFKLGATGRRTAAMLDLVPSSIRRTRLWPGQVVEKPKETRKRVALLTGCAQPVLKPGINEATVRLLNRLGVEVVLPKGEGCCGSLTHHMGREEAGLTSARRNIDAWIAEIEGRGLDAILSTASGCGSTIKDYKHLLRFDPAYADAAARVSALAMDVTEFLATLEMPDPTFAAGHTVAYHSPCSLQHGQKISTTPQKLLSSAGFSVVPIAEAHLCCGSAGTYNILQPDLSKRLAERKLANIQEVNADYVASSNVGCMVQLSMGGVAVLHCVELLDWAYGGPAPDLN